MLSPDGVFYLVALETNDITAIQSRMETLNLTSTVRFTQSNVLT